jgi:anti-sigma regulatory factor (Ser/Thr protein kinase)
MTKQSDKERIQAPSQLCVYDRSLVDNTLAFFDRVAVAVLHEKKYVELDFSKTTRITAAAALMLFAEVTRCQNCSVLLDRTQVVRLISPADQALVKVMDSTGLSEALRPGAEKKIARLWEEGVLFNSGNNPSEERALTRQILERIEGLSEVPDRLRLAISEAYLNIKHHAYDGELHPFIKDRWWQYAVLDEKNGYKTFSFLIYDKGVGIPSRVKSPAMMVKEELDCDKIERAFRTGFSSTNLSGRGWGSEDIIAPSGKKVEDHLLVMSNKGVVYFSGSETPKQKRDQKHSFSGTLLEWKFVL